MYTSFPTQSKITFCGRLWNYGGVLTDRGVGVEDLRSTFIKSDAVRFAVSYFGAKYEFLAHLGVCFCGVEVPGYEVHHPT
jgi:hypothetical protein